MLCSNTNRRKQQSKSFSRYQWSLQLRLTVRCRTPHGKDRMCQPADYRLRLPQIDSLWSLRGMLDCGKLRTRYTVDVKCQCWWRWPILCRNNAAISDCNEALERNVFETHVILIRFCELYDSSIFNLWHLSVRYGSVMCCHNTLSNSFLIFIHKTSTA